MDIKIDPLTGTPISQSSSPSVPSSPSGAPSGGLSFTPKASVIIDPNKVIKDEVKLPEDTDISVIGDAFEHAMANVTSFAENKATFNVRLIEILKNNGCDSQQQIRAAKDIEALVEFYLN